MKDELFSQLLKSTKQAVAIEKRRSKPSRLFQINGPKEIKRLRLQLHLTQTGFAALLGISQDTLQNWEQGRRRPQGSAGILLQIVARHPELLLEISH